MSNAEKLEWSGGHPTYLWREHPADKLWGIAVEVAAANDNGQGPRQLDFVDEV